MAVSPWYFVCASEVTNILRNAQGFDYSHNRQEILIYFSRCNHFPIVPGAQPSSYVWVPGCHFLGMNQLEGETSRLLVLYKKFENAFSVAFVHLMAWCLCVGTIVSTYLYIQH
jgi:hypothetical protein